LCIVPQSQIDADGDALIWSLAQAPAGMTIDASTGRLRWQPQVDQIGTHSVTVQVSDPYGGLATQRFTLVVNGLNTPPEFTSVPGTQGAIAQRYTYIITATDADQDPLRFSLGVHPDGMSMTSTGQVEWTPLPTQLGAATVEVQVTDSQGSTSTQRYSIVVGSTLLNQPPQIRSVPPLQADVGTTYRYLVQATDPDAGDSLTYELLQGPVGMVINPATGAVEWATPQVGSYPVSVGAVDSTGAGVAQRFTLQVIVNRLPVIRSTPATTVIVGETYQYDVQAIDPDGGALSYRLDSSAQSRGMTIDGVGRVRWSPKLADIGSYPVTLTVTDAAGASMDQPFTLMVSADTEAPKVVVLPSVNPVDKGSAVTLFVNATDNGAIASIQLTVGGVPVAIDGNGLASIPLNQVGDVVATATAKDLAGNVGTRSFTINVIDPTDVNAPVVSLPNLSGQVFTAPFDVIGTVSDTNLKQYVLEVAPLGSESFQTVFTGTRSVTNGVLGKFDPTLLENGSYTLRLRAEDLGGAISTTETQVEVTGELKLGNFQLSFTDLSIPVTGIPITVTRTYDSLKSNQQDELGYGWRLEFRDTDLRTSLNPKLQYDDYGLRQQGFNKQTRVYVTLPGGKREGFTFAPKPNRFSSFLAKSAAGLSVDPNLYTPAFSADAGVTNTLSVPNAESSTNMLSWNVAKNSYINLAGQVYDPADSYFGGVYLLTTKEGIVYEIDGKTGDLLKVMDTNGNVLTFNEGGVFSSTGKAVTFARDSQGRIVSLTDPMGYKVLYQYDLNGDLVGVSDREGNTSRHKYEAPSRPHYLTEIIDLLGRTGVKSVYNTEGRLSRLIDANNNAMQLDYDPTQSVVTVKDALNHPTTYVYDNRGNVVQEVDALGGVTKRVYDENNNLLSKIDAENRTTVYTYDNQRNQLTEIDPLGNTVYSTYGANGRLLSTTDPLGNTTTNTYDSKTGNLLSTSDALGNKTEYSYYPKGLVSLIKDPMGNTLDFKYDSGGNITQIVDALGHTTNFHYDANSHILSKTEQVRIGSDVQNVTTAYSYSVNGQMISTLDALGYISHTEYNPTKQVVSQIDALEHRTEYAYDAKGQQIKIQYADGTFEKSTYDVVGRLINMSDRAGHLTHYRYDALGQQTEIIFPDQTPGDLIDNPRIKTEYDKAGQVKAEINELGHRTEYEYDNAGHLQIVRDALGRERTFIYDAAGSLTSTTDPLGHITRYIYDPLKRIISTYFADGTHTSETFDAVGHSTTKTDQAGNTIQYEYDPLSRLTGVTDALGQKTRYGYDERGNLITQQDANRHIAQHEYDALNHRVATILPLGQRATMTYDALGRKISQANFNGETITYEYDSNSYLTHKQLPGTAVTYTYTPTGQKASVIDNRGKTTYAYDERNRLLSETNPDGISMQYVYDLVGNIVAVTTPTGTTTHTYDELNRLIRVADSIGEVANYDYDSASNLIQTRLANGVIETRQYDELNRLKVLENRNGSEVISSYRYTLDSVGNRTQVLEQNGRVVNYSYDKLYRLTNETIKDLVNGSRTTEYGYDAVGNRLSLTTSDEGSKTYTYDATNRLLTEARNGQTTTYSYDLNGNLLTKSSPTERVSYIWNAENRLMRATITDTQGTQTLQYRYNSDGIRIASIVNGEETRYLVDSNIPFAQVMEEYAPDSTVQISYRYGQDLVSQVQSGVKSFFQKDGLGSIRELTNTSSDITDTYIYDAFGNLTTSTGTTKNKYQFTGEQYDTALKSYYLRQRYYDPGTGRFASTDSFDGFLKTPLSLNKYLYGNANPTNFTDPNGEFSLSEIILGTIALNILLAVYDVGEYYVGNPFPRVSTTKFSSPNDAAIEALRKINPNSVVENIEFAGRICRYRHAPIFFYTGSRQGTESSSFAGVCPLGTITVADYHTHGGNDPRYGKGSENFSEADIKRNNEEHINGYISTPSGAIKLHIHSPDISRIPSFFRTLILGNEVDK
jgi:large repetitive protein